MAEVPSEIEERRAKTRLSTIRAIKRGATAIDRWRSLSAMQTDPLWTERARAAAALVPAGRKILDIGCNDMAIEAMLTGPAAYIPLDVVARDSRTIVVDLNKDALPQTDADFALGMGVLEYIFDLPKFFREVAAHFDDGLFSYHPLEKSPAKDRLAIGWVNALNSAELIALFRYAGFNSVSVTEYKPALHFYSIAKS
ncbi:hypothetical protein Q4610_01945 [Sphingobium sp. HBC34]|uniref:Methyltransferase domain-containing protein n=1 Tax=Sphingobium cyanobacteriorum TaxID=3063954 RepID=A0ABT8ZHX7_9SPHN|nr:hypothetical protein [Sphingobium sp. HBC34]MDO7833797.1 hypothetical protein [Sphingobium sp. HBC34]